VPTGLRPAATALRPGALQSPMCKRRGLQLLPTYSLTAGVSILVLVLFSAVRDKALRIVTPPGKQTQVHRKQRIAWVSPTGTRAQ